MAAKKSKRAAKRRSGIPVPGTAIDHGTGRQVVLAKTHPEEHQKLAQAERLLQTIKARRPQLEALLAETEQEHTIEEALYNFYYDSMELHELEDTTIRIVKALQQLAPGCELNSKFTAIVARGHGQYGDKPDTDTRYILEAFFHAQFMLRMACKSGRELEHAPQQLPSGWGALLFLYGLR
jgi:hypothetical protein